MGSAPTLFLLAASICAPAALPKAGLTQTPGGAPIGIRSTACRLARSSPAPLYRPAFHRHPPPAPLFRLSASAFSSGGTAADQSPANSRRATVPTGLTLG